LNFSILIKWIFMMKMLVEKNTRAMTFDGQGRGLLSCSAPRPGS